MKTCILLHGLLLAVSSGLGCNAMAGWRSSVAVTSFNSNRTPVAAAVAQSPSHLATGRTTSGVLENCIEACLNTLGSFVGGTITGCVIGGFMGATFGRVPDVGVLKSVQMKSGQMGADWGKLTAAFSGFTSASTVIRGRNDKWDQVVGACGAGAFLNRAKGPSGMAQGAATYGLFSLIFAVQSKEDPLDVVDIPVDAIAQKK
eukprot:jgi/Undpi1/8117/HiC_scaffold_24.g10589.m1